MRKQILALGAGLALLSTATPATSQSPAPCETKDANLTGELAPWSSKSDVTAAAQIGGLSKAELAIGSAFRAKLPFTANVAYVTQPEKPGGSVSHGGLLSFEIKEPGTYRIALSSAAWIDLVQEGRLLVSTAHGHGPECSSIRKIVDFSLTPGRYILQLSANADAEIGVMIVRGR